MSEKGKNKEGTGKGRKRKMTSVQEDRVKKLKK